MIRHRNLLVATALAFGAVGVLLGARRPAAALAIKKYFQPQTIVPMHYGTFPALAQEADVRAAFPGDTRLKVLKIGARTSL